MSDVTKDLAMAGAGQLIDVVDKSAEGAIQAIDALRGTVADVAGSTVRISDAISEDTIAEIQDLRARLISRLKFALDGVTKPLEVLP